MYWTHALLNSILYFMVTFFVDHILIRSSLKGEGRVLANSLRAWPITAGKAWHQDGGTAGHIASTLRKEMDAGTWLSSETQVSCHVRGPRGQVLGGRQGPYREQLDSCVVTSRAHASLVFLEGEGK